MLATRREILQRIPALGFGLAATNSVVWGTKSAVDLDKAKKVFKGLHDFRHHYYHKTLQDSHLRQFVRDAQDFSDDARRNGVATEFNSWLPGNHDKIINLNPPRKDLGGFHRIVSPHGIGVSRKFAEHLSAYPADKRGVDIAPLLKHGWSTLDACIGVIEAKRKQVALAMAKRQGAQYAIYTPSDRPMFRTVQTTTGSMVCTPIPDGGPNAFTCVPFIGPVDSSGTGVDASGTLTWTQVDAIMANTISAMMMLSGAAWGIGGYMVGTTPGCPACGAAGALMAIGGAVLGAVGGFMNLMFGGSGGASIVTKDDMEWYDDFDYYMDTEYC